MELTNATATTREGIRLGHLTARPNTAPPNLIPTDAESITPQLLTMVELDQEQIDRIVRAVPGGARNVQDIYPLSALQEGMLFEHLLDERAHTYVLTALLELQSRAHAVELANGLQKTIDRHDALRSAVLWENLPRPVQVVYRHVTLPVEELILRPEQSAIEQLKERMAMQRGSFDLRQAPLLRMQIAADAQSERCYVLVERHHIVFDHQSWNVVFAEALAGARGKDEQLAKPLSYRDHVAWSLAHCATQDAEAFFRRKLQDVTESTTPFGVSGLAPNISDLQEATDVLDPPLVRRVRTQARSRGVSVARLVHAAWAIVVARTSGREDVVCGTVLSGMRRNDPHAGPIVGLFVNTLPLRLNLRDIAVAELIGRTDAELAELRNYQQVPATLAQRCSGVELPAPLFTAVLNYRHSAGHSVVDRRTAEAVGVEVLAQRYRTNYPIMLVVDDFGDGLKVTAQTDPRIDPRRVVGYVKTVMRSLTEALEHAPLTQARELSILPVEERREVIEAFNATQYSYRHDQLVHELVERQAERTPHATAVTHGEHSLTYAELNRKANLLAGHLAALGVRPDQPVAIHIDRSVEMIVGVLAILKAGAAYVPLDPNYPAERLQYMLEDCAPHVVLTSTRLTAALPSTPAQVVALDELLRQLPDEAAGNRAAAEGGLSGSSLVYVIYTSGTTGRPKGTTMPHRAMVNLIEWHLHEPRLRLARRVLQFAALSFDVAFQEIFSTLSSGGTLVMLDEWIRRDVRALREFLEVNRIERLFVPPLMLQSLAEHVRDTGAVPRELLDVITAGEQLRISPEIVSFFREASDCRLHNHYGPTETHVVTALTLTGDPEQWPILPSIGKPIANTQIYILDDRLAPTPVGVIGEIYLSGANVARGYLNRPELNEQRFLPNAFSHDPQARMYKTGDIGRWRADGSIEYLGRNDDQVKIRGFRIELGEIEAQLARHPEVRESAVVAREDVAGEKRLVAYVTLRGSAAPGSDELRKHMQLTLPEYMVPAAFVVLRTLPLTPTGKLNRRALPAPSLDAYASRPYEAPKGEVEEILAGIWQELLRVERVGRHDNFFELGGHSLLLVQMMERLRRVNLVANVRSIYESRTLEALAGTLVGQADELVVPPNLIPLGCTALLPQMLPLVELDAGQIERIVQHVPGGVENIQDIYPLAPLQDGMLFHHLVDEQGGDTYIVSMLFAVSDHREIKDLISALQHVIDRHDILRTSILWEQLPSAVQIVQRRAALPVEEFSLDPLRDVREQLGEWMRPEQQQMDIRQAPLMRLRVTMDPHNQQAYAILQLHHLLGDHESLDTMLIEVTTCLRGLARELPEAKPYRIHVSQSLLLGRSREAEAFFRRKLGEVDEPTASFGLLDVHGTGGRVERVLQLLDPELGQRVRARARRCGVSAATLFHAAWALVVSMTSGRRDVVFGTVLLGRLQGNAGAHRILGLFMNTLPLRVQLQDVTAAELVERTQRELVDLLSHEQASLAVAQRCSAIAGRTPLFNALLNYRWSTVDLDAEFSSVGLQRLEIQSYTNYPLMFSVLDRGDSFGLEIQTDRRIDPRRVMAYVTTAMHSLVTALEQSSDCPALKLQVLPNDERRLIVDSFNDTRTPYPTDKFIHSLFEEQARRTPHAVAAIYAGQSLTYLELNQRANQLARFLRSAGVGRDDVVGLYAERSLDMIVGVLGTLKAGGAYLPLDPSHPIERLGYMLTDASPRVLIVQAALRSQLPATSAVVVEIDRNWNEIAGHAPDDLELPGGKVGPEDLAYIIYTSGSTGRPKGVMIEHRHVVNLWCGLEGLYGPLAACRCVALNASFTFDASVQQLVHLLSGRTLHIIPQEYRVDAAAMVRFLHEQRIEVIDCTPSQLKAWIAAGLLSGQEDQLRVVLIGGEAIDAAMWRVVAQCTSISFFNVYGPTECTVDATAARLDEQATPHIGRPMANRSVYILNGDAQVVPPGVAGEIHIGGAGIGRGYLNQAEITAQRFLPDPFSHDPSGRLYKTGDLGRWRVDGTIEYLARNDDQVKIRGYRIELGEIEVTLATHDHVKDAVVIAREDVPGQVGLVAYVVPKDQADGPRVEELRAHLKATLPEYMVPSAFVLIERLPWTSSGKIDRRALPTPDVEAYVSTRYEAPVGQVERALATVWQSVLQVERVGRHDNFFDLGCHSLLVLKALFSINRSLGSCLKVADIYRSATIRDLAARISGGAPLDDEPVDLSAEAALDPTLIALPGAPRTPPQAILLTGATGFVGRFLLTQLLLDTDATLYCLVRAKSAWEASLRIKNTLAEWDLWREEFEPRIVGVAGDMRLPQLGIDDAAYDRLCRDVDSIYHCATSMNHLETYSMAKAANVQSAGELLRIAASARPKIVNCISTLSVFGSRSEAARRVVDETTPIEHEQHRSSHGYAASKWVGEKIFLTAQQRGIPCNILRLGLVWPDTQRGRYDELQREYRTIKTCLLTGYGIRGYGYEAAPIPVDHAARAIVFLASRHSSGHGIFHLGGSGQAVNDLFERCNDACGTSLELLSYYDWVCEMKRLHKEGRALPALPLLEYAFSMDESSFHEHQRRARATRVHVSCVRTARELEAGGMVAAGLDDDLLRTCLDGMLTRDGELREAIYLPEPLSPVRRAAAALRLQL